MVGSVDHFLRAVRELTKSTFKQLEILNYHHHYYSPCFVLPPLFFWSLQPPCLLKQVALPPFSEPTATARLVSRRKDVWRQAVARAREVALQLCAPRRRLPSRDLGVIAGSSPMEPAAPMALEETSPSSTTAVSLAPNRTAVGYAKESLSFSLLYLANPLPFFLWTCCPPLTM